MGISRIGLLAAAGLLVAAGPAAATAASVEYVALGSSFAAGPDVGRPDPKGPPPCLRSLDNYAHKLAARRGLTLEDRTCSGARTADITHHHQFGLPFQIEAVGPETRLVTLTIGGNDVSYLGDLVAASCRNQGGTGCAVSPPETLDARFEALRTAFEDVLDEIQTRAPSARIVVVDYFTVAPASGTCPDRAPLTEADMAWARDRAARLRELTLEVATDAGATVLHASDLSVGHDLCAPRPWLHGWRDIGPHGRRLAVYHPRIEAMEAVAAELDRVLPAELSGPRSGPVPVVSGPGRYSSAPAAPRLHRASPR
jgi:hypothetical protein